jgi:hypothetical protein
MRVVAGQDVEPARVGQLAVRATGGVAEEVEHVGLLGPERVGRGHAHEYAEAPALRNGVPVFDQRARQRQGSAVAWPHHSVSPGRISCCRCRARSALMVRDPNRSAAVLSP